MMRSDDGSPLITPNLSYLTECLSENDGFIQRVILVMFI